MCVLFGMENLDQKMHTFLISQTIEMIEKEQREAERRPITKITHKGEIEIESQEPMKAHEPPEVRGSRDVTAHCGVFSSKKMLSLFFFLPLLTARASYRCGRGLSRTTDITRDKTREKQTGQGHHRSTQISLI